MNKLIDFLSGTKVLVQVDSPVNGHIVVKRDLAWGTYIQAAGLTQSGGVVEKIWKQTLQEVFSIKFSLLNCLILGLGGGTAAKLVRKNWPEAKIIGVDIDLIMVDLGTKYLGLNTSKTKVVIADAYDYCLKLKAKNKKFDLVIIDLYQGFEYPKKFESSKFLLATKRNLAKDGIIVFNRLYIDGKRKEAIKFGEKLEKVFSKVERFYPEANIMYICGNG